MNEDELTALAREAFAKGEDAVVILAIDLHRSKTEEALAVASWARDKGREDAFWCDDGKECRDPDCTFRHV